MSRAIHLCVLVGLAALVAALQPRSLRPAYAGTAAPVAVTVDLTRPGRAIPQSFLGLSIETYTTPLFTGTPMTGPNPSFVQLLQNLSAPCSFSPRRPPATVSSWAGWRSTVAATAGRWGRPRASW